MTPLSELITDMGLCDAAMQGLRAERREQVVGLLSAKSSQVCQLPNQLMLMIGWIDEC